MLFYWYQSRFTYSVLCTMEISLQLWLFWVFLTLMLEWKVVYTPLFFRIILFCSCMYVLLYFHVIEFPSLVDLYFNLKTHFSALSKTGLVTLVCLEEFVFPIYLWRTAVFSPAWLLGGFFVFQQCDHDSIVLLDCKVLFLRNLLITIGISLEGEICLPLDSLTVFSWHLTFNSWGTEFWYRLLGFVFGVCWASCIQKWRYSFPSNSSVYLLLFGKTATIPVTIRWCLRLEVPATSWHFHFYCVSLCRILSDDWSFPFQSVCSQALSMDYSD